MRLKWTTDCRPDNHVAGTREFYFFVFPLEEFDEFSSPSELPMPVALLPASAAPLTAPFAAPAAAPTTTAFNAFLAFFRMPGEERFFPLLDLLLPDRFFAPEADFLPADFLPVFRAAMFTPP